MITPIELEKKSFKSGIGYDKKDVDAFFSEISESYEKFYKENMELKEKLQNMAIVLQNYKTIEKSLQKALVLAQKAAEETKENARMSADTIEADAHVKAKEIIADAKTELVQIEAKKQFLLSQYNIYKTQYRQIIKTQLELLENDGFQSMLQEESVKENVNAAEDNCP